MNLNKYIEYTLISPGLPSKKIKSFAELGITLNYYALVLNFTDLNIAKKVKENRKSSIKLVTIHGFPWDKYSNTIFEFLNDFDELDMVHPMSYLSMSAKKAKEQIRRVKEKIGNKILKVIVETESFSTDRSRNDQIIERIKIAEDAGANIIKTNTGLIPRPFEILIDHIRLIKQHTKLPIKASGGIKTPAQCEELIKLGVSRIGTSTAIVNPKKIKQKKQKRINFVNYLRNYYDG